MIGSGGIAALIGHLAFWVLLVVGFVTGEFGAKHAVIFGGLWVLGRFALPYLPGGELLFPPYIAMVDVVLVLMIFKGDIRLR